MIVADAGALSSLAGIGVLGHALGEFDVRTTDVVVETLEAESAFHGASGDGARAALAHRDGLAVHRWDRDAFESSRVDRSQGGCVALAIQLEADVLLTDDLRALAELDRLVPCVVADSSALLSALVRRGVLSPGDARFRMETMADLGGWLARPVYRRAIASLVEGR